jgi:hypothetical protein
MCEPATLTAAGAWIAANAGTIAAVSAVASTGVSLYAQGEAADKQNEFSLARGKAINKGTVDSYAQLNRQGVEDAQNATVTGNNLQREMATRIASARTAAAGVGVSGLSVDAMLLDLSGKGLEAGTTAEMNYARTQASRMDQAAALQGQGTNELSKLRMATGPTGGDYAAAGFKVANAGAGYARGSSQGNLAIRNPGMSSADYNHRGAN